MIKQESKEGVSVIIRMHEVGRLPNLEVALASLLGQQYRPIEAIVALQNFDEDELSHVNDLLAMYEGYDGFSTRALNHEFPEDGDHRAELVNRSIPHTSYRYLSFLDNDDVVYPNMYKNLVKRLKKTDKAISMCGVVQSDYMSVSGNPFVLSKKKIFQNHHKLDFFFDNQYPVHSYVIDQDRVKVMPTFWEGKSRNEDYKFLLDFLSVYDSDDYYVDQTLCEYMVSRDGDNTIMAYRSDKETVKLWKDTIDETEEYKEGLRILVNYIDLKEFVEKKSRHTAGSDESSKKITGLDVANTLSASIGGLCKLTKLSVDGVMQVGGNRIQTHGWICGPNLEPPALFIVCQREDGVACAVIDDFVEREDVRIHLGAKRENRYGFDIDVRGIHRPEDLMVKVLFRSGVWGEIPRKYFVQS